MKKGFTLIELLITISIIGILVAISLFGLSGIRETSRDSRRKSDLESVRSGLELYKSDCNSYPAVIPNPTFPLNGSGETTSCSASNEYISSWPADPMSGSRNYLYSLTATSGYEMCASLEQGGTTVTCGGASNCGTATCNYKVTNP